MADGCWGSLPGDLIMLAAGTILTTHPDEWTGTQHGHELALVIARVKNVWNDDKLMVLSKGKVGWTFETNAIQRFLHA